MRVCIPTNSPGGPDAPVANSFQESDLFDFYDSGDSGGFALFVQIPNCAGTCKDDVETVVRRGAEAVIVDNITSNSLHRLVRAGISVYRARAGPSKESLEALRSEGLPRLDKIRS